jgi:multisubunit Na+/H+ antiporter MnhF subunit
VIQLLFDLVVDLQDLQTNPSAIFVVLNIRMLNNMALDVATVTSQVTTKELVLSE